MPLSRIYGGNHFDFSNTDGLALGTQIGDWILEVLNIDRIKGLLDIRKTRGSGPPAKLWREAVEIQGYASRRQRRERAVRV